MLSLRRGFSMIELFVVLVIAGVVAGLSMSRFAAYLAQERAVMGAVRVLSITMTCVRHSSSSLTQANRRNDIVAKRTFAMQQQANVIGALPFQSLTTTLLPPAKTFTLGDFTYDRRVTLATTGS